VRRGRKNNPARLIKPLLGLLAMAAGVGVAVALAAPASTELGGTTDSPVYTAYAPIVQDATTPGTSSYTTPNGVLTSWRYHSASTIDPGSTVRLELFRRAGAAHVWEAVAASDAKTLAPSTGYEFKERIPVKQGYVLGLDPDSAGMAGTAVGIDAGASDVLDQFGSDVQVGQTATGTGPLPPYRVNASATIEPDADGDGYGDVSQDKCPTQAATHGDCSNSFSFGKLKRNRDRGTATLPVTLPGAGKLSLSGKGVVKQPRVARASADRAVSAAGTVKLLIKAKGKAKRKLKSKGKVRVKVRVTYTPTDGTPNTKKPKVKLIKKLQG
jgi:hypothetical protein